MLSQVKIIDYGSAVFCEDDNLTDWAGTLFYASPECSSRSYGRPADVWAAGVVMWVLVSGLPPQESLFVVSPTSYIYCIRNVETAVMGARRTFFVTFFHILIDCLSVCLFTLQVYGLLQKGSLGEMPSWLSNESCQLMRDLLEANPHQRPTAAQALQCANPYSQKNKK
jgi:serine/threonine protein kinase